MPTSIHNKDHNLVIAWSSVEKELEALVLVLKGKDATEWETSNYCTKGAGRLKNESILR